MVVSTQKSQKLLQQINNAEKANCPAAAVDIRPMPLMTASPDQNQNDNVIFSAVSKNRNAQFMALHGALPP